MSQSPRDSTYPGDDELTGVLVVGVDPLPKKGDEAHQVELAAFCHNVLWIEGMKVVKSQRLACYAAGPEGQVTTEENGRASAR